MTKCVVITGSIGCGKSSVCKILQSKGFLIIDADIISRRCAGNNTQKIRELFGEEYVKNGIIDRKKLGELVFSDKNAKTRLERLLHPLIKGEILREIEIAKESGKLFFVDIPLYFENDNYTFLRPVAVVYAPVDIAIERIIKRDSLSPKEAKKRVLSQLDINEKVKKADFVIDNSKDLQSLHAEVEKFLEEVGEWFCTNTARAGTTF